MRADITDALSTLFSLQRWNAFPRVETWVEAENVAYVAHLAYAVGRSGGLSDDALESILVSVLLKSFMKYELSDISFNTRQAIGEDAWLSVEEAVLEPTVALFPEDVREWVKKNLESSLVSEEDTTPGDRLLHLVQMEIAIAECDVNQRAYPDSGYQEIIQELQEDQAALCGIDRFCQSLDSLKEKGYLEEIRRLKYLRRWNTRNRAIETSVMGHTFVVAALALVAARLEVERGDEVLPEGFVLKVMLRALFHDLPEVYTGDVITPVKVRIVKSTGMSWGDIETKVLAPFYKASSPEVIADVKRWSLLDELGPDKENDPVGALVNDCDKMALLVECLIEERMGRESVEMDRAFQRNARGLLRSKWTSVQDLVVDLLFAPRR